MIGTDEKRESGKSVLSARLNYVDDDDDDADTVSSTSGNFSISSQCRPGRPYKVKVKLATLIEGDPKASFSNATTRRSRTGCYSIP